ncbi:YceD family protein [Sulfurospirillum arcachonense]|uniref:YceD family protein n=1 Tax=Sulfurospirillum arcachonense TaxID=57666 RepID=UPI0004681A82|nr:DNA-binding protein [Sulfurospirillum arcachonense]
MQIVFKKVPTSGVDFETSIKDIKFYGTANKESKNLVQCIGKIEGTLDYQCDRCGNDFPLHVKEDVKLFASDGVYKSDDDLLDVIEFFDESINFDTMLESELGTLQSDYYYCSTCKEN